MKLAGACIWGTLLLSVLGGCSEATAENTLVLDVGDVSKTRCSLPSLNSTTAGTKFVSAFSQIQKGWTYQQVRSHINIAPASPEPVQMQGLAAYTMNYNIKPSQNVLLNGSIMLNRHKKVSLVGIGVVQNLGQESEKACFWKFQI